MEQITSPSSPESEFQDAAQDSRPGFLTQALPPSPAPHFPQSLYGGYGSAFEFPNLSHPAQHPQSNLRHAIASSRSQEAVTGERDAAQHHYMSLGSVGVHTGLRATANYGGVFHSFRQHSQLVLISPEWIFAQSPLTSSHYRPTPATKAMQGNPSTSAQNSPLTVLPHPPLAAQPVAEDRLFNILRGNGTLTSAVVASQRVARQAGAEVEWTRFERRLLKSFDSHGIASLTKRSEPPLRGLEQLVNHLGQKISAAESSGQAGHLLDAVELLNSSETYRAIDTFVSQFAQWYKQLRRRETAKNDHSGGESAASASATRSTEQAPTSTGPQMDLPDFSLWNLAAVLPESPSPAQAFHAGAPLVQSSAGFGPSQSGYASAAQGPAHSLAPPYPPPSRYEAQSFIPPLAQEHFYTPPALLPDAPPTYQPNSTAFDYPFDTQQHVESPYGFDPQYWLSHEPPSDHQYHPMSLGSRGRQADSRRRVGSSPFVPLPRV
ncbi:hypothetical protein JCM10908_002707 [Rhodotorula pacifica]|uniref:uncharacterized protein n=1 Tax=Rhodotorula pacifica TaxID=1495444 RepID=UPI00316E5E0E